MLFPSRPLIPQHAAPPALLAPATAEHQILQTLSSLVMQLNNQANYLGLVFLRIDNIGAYVSLFNLHFTVKQQYLSPRTSAAPRLPLSDSKGCPARNCPGAQKPPPGQAGGPSRLPADTSLSLEVTSTAQPGTATLSPGEQEQEGGDGGATGRDPSAFPGQFISTWLMRRFCFPGTVVCRLRALHLQKNTHAHARNTPLSKCFC